MLHDKWKLQATIKVTLFDQIFNFSDYYIKWKWHGFKCYWIKKQIELFGSNLLIFNSIVLGSQSEINRTKKNGTIANFLWIT